MKILKIIAAATVGIGGAALFSALMNAGTTPAVAMREAVPAVITPESQVKSGVDAFVAYQRGVLSASIADVPDNGLPAPEIRYDLQGCVMSVESKVWQWQADIDAQQQAAFRKMLGDEAMAEVADLTPARVEGQKVLAHSVERFDLRQFDLTEFKQREKSGAVLAYASRIPFTGGADPTNLALIEAWVATEDDPEKAAKIRDFATKGRIVYKFVTTIPPTARQDNQKETFLALASAAVSNENVTNINIGRIYTQKPDAAAEMTSGNLGQPKHVVVFANTSAEAEAQIVLLREWKAKHCE